ncbi:peptidoglycan-associated lipoprotein Pal [Caulobacter sp. 17J65-9]|uniref:peptidoglycan-associated lipoprotein Pal n=1 Tax=Caulobacter sp. 17J65-9 TaxID=2709382 RepID=UPI0013C60453|nr:peptidoglycan-associated lipoprotein Pal [Caulobacter sp. 17J65-9]NEX91647.1 peptidoglycan-associated lipoprotein Pal [Caulobacter sp. 17J65-9]
MKNVVSRVALVALMAASMAACAKKPTPEPIQPQPQPPVEQPQPQPQPPVQQQPVGPIPGSEQDFVINAGDRVYFDFDQYSVRDEARGVLDAQAAWLARYPGVTVRIEGNADERGTREYNMALGARRANAVRDYLVSRGVSASRIETISYGKERPIDPGSNEDAWARNRNAHTAITSGAR